MGGEERAPCAASAREPIPASSAVVTPARTCAAMARSTLATIMPQARSLSNCSGRVMDMNPQLQPHPPPQQPPPPAVDPPDDLAEVPLLDPFPELKTDSWSEFLLPLQCGQAISLLLFSTIISKCVWQSSQMYS